MRNLKKLSSKVLIFFIILAFLVIFLLTTSAGLFITTKLAKLVLPGEFYAEDPRGRLIDHFSVAKLTYKNDNFDLNLTNLQFQWQWKALFKHQFFVENLQANLLEITPKKQKESLNKSGFNFPKLPFELNLNNIAIDTIQLNRTGGLTQLGSFNLQAKLHNQLWQVSKLTFTYANLNFALQAQSQPFYPYSASAKLLFTFSQYGQEVKGFIDLGGDFALYHWHGELTSPANLVVNGTLRDGSELNSLVKWLNFALPIEDNKSLLSPEGSMQINGKIPDLNFNLAATTTAPFVANFQVNATASKQNFISNAAIKIPKGFLHFNLAYSELANPKIQGKLEARSFDLMGDKFPIQALNVNSQFSGDSIENLLVNSDLNALYFGSLLKGTFLYQQQQINAAFNLGKNHLLLNGTPPYSWQIKANFPEPKLLHPALKGLQTTLSLDANLSDAKSGQASFTIQPGSLQLQDENSLKTLKFLGGQLRAELQSLQLNVDGQLTIDQNKSLTLKLALPEFQLEKGLTDSQKIKANLNLKVNSLSFLESFSSAISKIEGELNASLNASGLVKKPVLEGNLLLSKGQVLMSELGLDLNPIQVNLQSRNNEWDLQGSIKSQGQPLNLNGKGRFAPHLKGSLNIDASNFPVMKTSEYLINLSPQLVLNFSPKSVDIKGTILVPSAQIKPKSFDNTINLSSDAVFTNAKQSSAPNPLPLNTDINLVMGDDVALNVKGLQGFLTGSIQLLKLPQSELKASGALTVRDGKYKAYGQDLKIA
ncbi:MAG: translocation/assembly module TamB domain-containing protein, partial [Tatlockia sp.]|nr:translocation/assembly module TamB domain-containing protein [Tatlockia sp.]